MKRYILILLCLTTLKVQSQTLTVGGYDIKGITIDSASSKAIDYNTVALKTEKNVPVKSVLTASDGSFHFKGIKSGKYVLSVISVGYQTKIITLDLTAVPYSRDLGSIALVPQNNKLKEVVVTADKPIIKQEVDRIAYDLQADPESKSNNVLEMMRKVPLLSVDSDDNIMLKGQTNYKILINGRPSSMMERNPRDILRSMPASSIQSIEVITNPPAKYDGEGIGGIINIITNKKIDNGYNASVNLNQRFPAGGPGTGSNLTFKQGRFGLSAFGGGNLSKTPLLTNDMYRSTTGINASNLSQYVSREAEGRNGYIGAELSFEIDSLNLISTQFNLNGNRSENTTDGRSYLQNVAGTELQRYRLLGNNFSNGGGRDAAFNYQLGFKSSKTRLLTFSYRYYQYSMGQDNGLSASEQFNYDVTDYTQHNEGSSEENTIQLDYVHPVKKLNIEAGVKVIHRRNASDFQYNALNPVTGDFETDPSRSNVFDNIQQVLGAYNTYQYNLKNWGFKAGFRLEQTIIDADFTSTSTQVRQEYLNLIPSVSINRKFKNMSGLNFGFSQRMQRPSIYQLNPFVDRSNPNIESSGNPNLHPVVGTSINLSYNISKKGSMNFGIGTEFIRKLIMPISVFDPTTYVTRTTFGNTGRARVYYINANINRPITKRLNLTFNGNLVHGRVEGVANNVLVKNQGFMYNFSTTGSYRFEKGWRLNANMYMNGPNLSIQGTSNTFIGTGFSVNKDLIKDKLSFSAAGNNLFQKYRTNIRESFGPDFFQTSNNRVFYRSFNTSLNYKFGKLKSSIKKNSRGIRNDDVAN